MQDESVYTKLEKFAKEREMKIFKISNMTKEGIEELIDYVSETLKTVPKEEIFETEEKMVYTLNEEEKFKIEIVNGVYVITGKAIERLMGRININDNESMYYFHKSLVNLGVEEKLKELKIKEGDHVKISDYEFEWYN